MSKETFEEDATSYELAESLFKEIYGYDPQIIEGNQQHELIVAALQKGIVYGANCQAKKLYTEKDLIELLNFVSKEYNIGNGIGWFHTHETLEEVQSTEVLNQFKKK